MIIAIEQRGAVPLVRLAWNDPIQAKAVLDSGAAGVLVPMVNSRAEAELAVSMTKYPPLGSRGVGLARAQGYGGHFAAYWKNSIGAGVRSIKLEHEPAADPVVFAEKVQAAFAHSGAVERRTSAGHQAHRVAAGVRVDAEKCFAHGLQVQVIG